MIHTNNFKEALNPGSDLVSESNSHVTKNNSNSMKCMSFGMTMQIQNMEKKQNHVTRIQMPS